MKYDISKFTIEDWLVFGAYFITFTTLETFALRPKHICLIEGKKDAPCFVASLKSVLYKFASQLLNNEFNIYTNANIYEAARTFSKFVDCNEFAKNHILWDASPCFRRVQSFPMYNIQIMFNLCSIYSAIRLILGGQSKYLFFDGHYYQNAFFMERV